MTVPTAPSATRASRARTHRARHLAVADGRTLERAAAELQEWRAARGPVGLDEVAEDRLPGLRAALVDALWQTRVEADGGRTNAELVVGRLLSSCPPEELSRHADLVRTLLRALGPERRALLVADLGPADSLRVRFVEGLARPTDRVARAYAGG